MERLKSTPEQAPIWIRPNLKNEGGELVRVVETFLHQEPNKENVENLYGILNSAPVVELSEEEWEKLENTDSFQGITPGELSEARVLTEEQNQELSHENRRNFDELLTAFRDGKDMECPTIIRKSGVLHLVSGNTRLMLSRALKIRPKVIIGDIG
ncbi:MAG: hypothetical protein JWN49_502 [Parcubacteria group bacterium]|nr:hypothetical protein [Parcubacteria group bacterium]